MNAAALKISITQRILSLTDVKILAKISTLLDQENVVGFQMNGDSIAEIDFVAEIHADLNLLSEGKLETYSSEEVKRKIIG